MDNGVYNVVEYVSDGGITFTHFSLLANLIERKGQGPSNFFSLVCVCVCVKGDY